MKRKWTKAKTLSACFSHVFASQKLSFDLINEISLSAS